MLCLFFSFLDAVECKNTSNFIATSARCLTGLFRTLALEWVLLNRHLSSYNFYAFKTRKDTVRRCLRAVHDYIWLGMYNEIDMSQPHIGVWADSIYFGEARVMWCFVWWMFYSRHGFDMCKSCGIISMLHNIMFWGMQLHVFCSLWVIESVFNGNFVVYFCSFVLGVVAKCLQRSKAIIDKCGMHKWSDSCNNFVMINGKCFEAGSPAITQKMGWCLQISETLMQFVLCPRV